MQTNQSTTNMKACLLILATVVAVAWAEAPYPPSGYRPAKAFLLPVRARQQEYGAPPRPVYGAPPAPTEAPETTTASENAVEGGRADEAQPALYYVLLPDGRLQRVLYTTGTSELGYSAQLRIHDVEPVPPAPFSR
ncbi:hypothetical protein B566_EDAN011786, partial [Ephemera danica]